MISESPITSIHTNDLVVKKTRILIVDDSESNIKVLGSVLKKHNYEVLTSIESTRAFDIALEKQPDLILLDILMPHLDGYSVYKLLKDNSKTAAIPVMFISSLNATENLVKGFDLGAVDYISKPFNHDELIARVKHQIKQKTANKHINALFNSQHHTFIIIDENYIIVNFNDTANERELVFTNENYKIGDSILNHINESDREFIVNKFKKGFKGKIVEFERCYFINEKRRWFNYLIEPIKNRSGVVVGCVLSGAEITLKKEENIREIEYHRKVSNLYSEIQQSLSYAAYIQKSILPDNLKLLKYFDDSFVLLRSKEKVSGDFYWNYELENKHLLILGDCTGHGVPGALLTAISIMLLERLVKYEKIHCPEKILFELNNNIVSILNTNSGGVKDGLEMAVCLFDKTEGILEFAAAKRSAFIVKEGVINEVKGDRLDIGGYPMKKYTKQIISNIHGASIYLFSDGITDQIGGDKNKKFMKKKLSKLILSLSMQSMATQKEVIEDTIVNWTKNEEQTDDMLLIGIKL
ncbi:MAG: response regulator [Bacteroidota bacterium]